MAPIIVERRSLHPEDIRLLHRQFVDAGLNSDAAATLTAMVYVVEGLARVEGKLARLVAEVAGVAGAIEVAADDSVNLKKKETVRNAKNSE